MARIRSVKPEFWTSEQIAECSPNVRLLFIGMWNFCDDYGVHPASCARLKMEVFPADAISSADIRRMIDELLANYLLQEYEIDGSQYWLVTGFDKHQKPDTKTGKYPLPDGSIGGKIRRKVADNSPNVPVQDAERSPPEVEVDLVVDLEEVKKKEKPTPQVKPAKFDFKAALIEKGITASSANDFMETRKTKKLTPTETAFKGIVAEIDKSGMDFSAAIDLCCRKGWGGFEAKWLKPEDKVCESSAEVDMSEIITMQDGRTFTRGGLAFIRSLG